MKKSSEYSKRLLQLYQKMKRKYPRPTKVFYEEPLEAVVYAAISENITAAQTQSVMKRIEEHFVDLNDMRVSRTDELLEVAGPSSQEARNTFVSVNAILRYVFAENNMMSLKGLKKVGKRRARKKLEQIEGITDFAVNYCMLTSLKSHVLPLTKKMKEYLRTNEIVHPDADQQQIESFLARQIRSENTYEFYALLRRTSETDGIDMSEKAKIPKAQKKKK
jgi:endonuclease III